ncbi:MAG: MBL fold metallo-hydrolase [Desulfobacteraceae bacterium]|nr:MBL fold metallo-hydrolase [Desulfobacteraceae bacterium]MBC2756294.1 MBL fold metallo-hydrolase [Desulfobacteraceae bacterium]
MKISKFSQSTFTLENDQGKRLIIDPGKYNYSDEFKPSDFGRCDLMIITHKHADHHFPEAETAIYDLHKPTVITNKEIANTRDSYKGHNVGDVIEEHGFKITLINTDHFAKGESITNFGLLIETDGKRFYHTSDTRFMEAQIFDLETVKNCEVLFVPISNRGVVMGIEDAIVFTATVEPSIVIPGHCDSPKDSVRVNPEDFLSRFNELRGRIETLARVEVKLMKFGDSLTV